MSSALAAFAKTQSARAEAELAEVVDEVGYASEEDSKPNEREIPVSKPAPSSLAAFAQSQAAQTTKKTVTLVDIAKEQQSKPTLVDVARKIDNQNDQATAQKLSAIAADIRAEEHETAALRAKQIEQELAITSQQVKQEQQAARHAQVAQALRTAAVEQEEQEQAYSAHDDEFEAEDPAVKHSVQRVVEATTTPNNAKQPQKPTLSVDRHLLKQRQQRHGLESKSTGKAKTMKDKLSAFQFDQLSLTQQRVFLAMLVDDKKSDGSGKKRCNMHAIEALAMDRATQLKHKQKLLKQQPLQYAKLDDVRHCRFKPKIKNTDAGRGGRDDDDDDDDGGGNQRREDFIRRMEATERVRTEQLRRTRAERDYLAQIDKKECPQCGNPQSYAELTQKRKKCPNCGVTYKSRLTWGEVADEFLARMASHLKTQLGESSNPQDNQRSDASPPPPSKRPMQKLWREVRDEFLGRVQLDLAQREMTKELILQELEAQCTFAPQISARARRLELGDFDERLRRDLENRRVRQEQYRLLSAAIARAEASSSGGKGPAKKPTAALPRSFEMRLKKDLEQRRERQRANENPKISSGRSRGLY